MQQPPQGGGRAPTQSQYVVHKEGVSFRHPGGDEVVLGAEWRLEERNNVALPPYYTITLLLFTIVLLL